MKKSDARFDECVNKIPLYQRLYDKSDSRNVPWKTPPILEKSLIRSTFPQEWLTDSLKKALENGEVEFATTSGTTDDRLQIVRKIGWWNDEHHRIATEYKPLHPVYVDGKKRARLTTPQCSNAVCFQNSPSYEERIIDNTLDLNISDNPFKWGKSEIEKTCAEWNRFEPYYLIADPHYLAIFLKLKNKYGVTQALYPPHLLSFAYERSSINSSNYIRETFKQPISDLYGTTEFGYLYYKEGSNQPFKIFPESIDVHFQPISAQRGIYHLIVTSYKNIFMPLLNYATGDIFELDTNSINNNADNKKIQPTRMLGRLKNCITGHENQIITEHDIDTVISSTSPNILLYEFNLTRSTNSVQLRYVTLDDQPISNEHKQHLTQKLIDLLGKSSRIQAIHTLEIPPAMSGKFVLVNQKED